ncbi:MAG: tripartite tricarboxylate transporter substrate binding protein [Betaproteobacteria bacterium]|nr:tripartite tricarboxylate transporter substrate binding protein [Betaproteobacteria bacterium]
MKPWLLALATALVPVFAAAQAPYPTRPVKLVVPFPPGGSTDIVARLLGGKLSESLGQPVVIENKPGAGAALGTETVAKAAPDGYTVLITALPSIVTAPLTNPNVRYDPLRDLTHIAMIGSFPNALVVRSDSPLKSVADLVAYAKANPGRLFYGSAGPGSAGHLTGELLRERAGIDIVHIPYKGAAPAFADLLAGQIGADFDGVLNALHQAQAGRIRLLAVSSSQRLPQHPDLPTIDETVKGVSGDSWFGLAGPANLPAAITQRLEAETVRALDAPDVRSRLEDTGMTVTALRGSAFVDFIRADISKWTSVIKSAKLEQGK